VLDHLARNAREVGRAVPHGLPPEPEPAGYLVAECRLVQVAGGLGVEVERPGVERAPAAIGALRAVRDNDVRVKQWVAGARGAVSERRRYEATSFELRDPAVDPSPRDTRLPLEVAERVPHRGLVCADKLAAHRGLGDAEDDGDALRCLEGQVESGDGA
jgi:hypothetical protein